MFLKLCVFVCVSLIGSQAASTKDMNNLLDHLFNSSLYNKYVRPIFNQSAPIEVSVKIRFFTIKEFDIPSGQVSVVGLMKLNWRDDLLSWNSSDFGNISRISLPVGTFWKPRIMMIYGKDGVEEVGNDFSPAWLSSAGKVLMLPSGLFQTVCDINIVAYPWDTQICAFQFVPTVNDLSELIFTIPRYTVDLQYMQPHGEWNIIDTKCEIISYTDEDGLAISAVQAIVKLRRRPEFLLTHKLTPVGLLSTLLVLVFCVPPDTGERVTFSITLFLAYTVFVTSGTSDLPRNSMNISIYSISLVTMNILATICVVLSVIVVKMSKETVKPVPTKLKKFVIPILKTCKFRSRKKVSVMPELDGQNDDDAKTFANNNEFVKTISGFENQTKQSEQPEIQVTWLGVAEAMDVIFFWIFIIVCTILNITITTIIFTSRD